MVVKIQQAASDTERALVYNGNKMTGPVGILEGEDLDRYEEDHAQTGHVLAVVNVPETSDLRNEFARLKMKNRKNAKGRPLEKPVFHMSINPGENDRKLSEKEVVAFVGELMERLGYKDNPYAIFRHNDISREHFHVVATRIGQDGQKVKDSFENKRCNDIIGELARKYGYTVGSDDGVTLDEEMEKEEKQNKPQIDAPEPVVDKTPADGEKDRKKGEEGVKKDFIPPFDTESGTPVLEQYGNAHGDAMQWSFSTPEQYAALMLWRYNIKAVIYNEAYYYSGLAKKGQTAPASAGQSEIGTDALKEVVSRCKECSGDGKQAMKYKKSQKERIEKLTEWAMDKAENWIEFRKLMERKGVYVVLSWSEDGQPFGATYLDRATRCAWKASETRTDLNWMKAKVTEKGWEMTRHPRYEKIAKPVFKADMEPEKMKAAASRRTAPHAVRHDSPSVLESLANKKGVGKTQRSNVDASKNKDRLKKEGEEDKNDIII